MGMAASQARFLGLTARLNNIEFEGQQINQERTSLSNKSASYYTDLLGMKVPTAPSVEQYTQTVYSFNDGALTNQITSLIATTNGTFNVSYIKSWKDDFSIVSAAPSIITQVTAGTITSGAVTADGAYKIGSDRLRKLDDWNGFTFSNAAGGQLSLVNGKFYDNQGQEYTGNDVTVTYGLDVNDYYKELSIDQLKGLSEEEVAYKNLLNNTNGDTDNYLVRYVQNTSTGEYQAVFYNQKDVISANYNNTAPQNSQSFIAAYKIGSAEKIEEVKGVEDCELEQDSTGRFINITIEGKTYALTTNTITDQDAYEGAMNQYEYDKALYDQSIDEINAKIEIVQAEDKNLELRLKQLDTEHNAVNQEKETISKYLQKSIENGFKSFG